MKVWLPTADYLGGQRRFCEYLAEGLTAAGQEAIVALFPVSIQYIPWALRRLTCPAGIDVVIANIWSAFALGRPGARLVVVDHLAIHDASYRPYRSASQAVFHQTILRGHVLASLRAADAVVAVSQFVAESLRGTFAAPPIEVIYNGIDTDFFHPAATGKAPLDGRPMRLLFAGDLIRRKGADLLAPIMAALGQGFELMCVVGGRGNIDLPADPMIRVRRGLTPADMREVYQWADLLLFPSRLEGFGFVAAEALACGTPVVAAATSALPEVIADGASGLLCPADDAASLAAAIRQLAADPMRLAAMGRHARADTVRRFDRSAMVGRYLALFERLGLR